MRDQRMQTILSCVHSSNMCIQFRLLRSKQRQRQNLKSRSKDKNYEQQENNKNDFLVLSQFSLRCQIFGGRFCRILLFSCSCCCCRWNVSTTTTTAGATTTTTSATTTTWTTTRMGLRESHNFDILPEWVKVPLPQRLKRLFLSRKTEKVNLNYEKIAKVGTPGLLQLMLV